MTQKIANDKLNLRTKFAYGIGDWGTSAATAARALFWGFFLGSVVGLPLNKVGIIILIGRVWDSINDPLVGTISDRVNTRWGRRRPFLIFGAVPFGITFFLLFFTPPINNESWLIVYYGAAFILFDTMYTVINVPYSALTPQLTEDYDERSSLAGWRIALAILASLVAGATFQIMAENLIATALQDTIGLERALQIGYAITAAFWSITLILSPLILAFNIEEKQLLPPDNEPYKPFLVIKEVFSNLPFRLAASIYLLSFTAADIVIWVFLWFLIFYIGAGAFFRTLVVVIVLGIAFLTMPLTVKIMRRYDKRTAYMGTMAIYGMVLLIMSQIPRGGEIHVLVAGFFAGFGHGAANVIPWAMVADVVDVDELHSGKRREGLYSGYLVFMRKFASAAAIFIATQVLAFSGFREGTTGSLADFEQPESALRALRILVGVVPAVMLFTSIFVAWRYPLNRDAHRKVLDKLAIRRANTVERQSNIITSE